MNSHSVHTEYTSDILRLVVEVIVAQMSFDDSRNTVVLGSGVNSNGNQNILIQVQSTVVSTSCNYQDRRRQSQFLIGDVQYID